MDDDAALRIASFSDYPSIRRLMEAYGLETKPEVEWRHLWEQNPVWQRHAESWPIGWVLEAQQRIVGFLGNIPLEYELDGRQLTASVACEWVVEKSHRAHNPRLTEAYFSQQIPDLFLNTTAINATGRIFEKQGGKKAPVSGYDTSLFWILRPRNFIKSLFSQRNLPSAPILAAAASIPISLLASWRQRRIRRLPSHGVAACSDFDSRFDEFWLKLRREPGRLLCNRDLSTLRWHFRHAIADGKLRIFYTEDSRSIVSYACFYRQDNQGIGLRRIRLVDFQTLYPQEDHLQRILTEAFAHYSKEPVDMIEVVGFCEEKREAVRSLAPFERKLPAWMFYYKARDPSLGSVLQDNSIWDPCSYDGDGSL